MPRYYGPYRAAKKISPVNYVAELPDDASDRRIKAMDTVRILCIKRYNPRSAWNS